MIGLLQNGTNYRFEKGCSVTVSIEHSVRGMRRPLFPGIIGRVGPTKMSIAATSSGVATNR